MEIKNICLNYNIDSDCPPKRETVTHVNNVNTRIIELTLKQGDDKLSLDSECKASASIVERVTKKLIASGMECSISESGNILIPIDNLHFRDKMDINIEVSVNDSSGGRVLTLPFPIWVRVNPSVLDDAEVSDKSLGTVPELLKEAKELVENYRYELTEDDVERIAAEVDVNGKENISNKKTIISNQSQTGDSDTHYPTVGAVRDFVNLVKSDLEDYVDDEIDNIPETYTKSEVDSLVDRKAKSAYDIAVDNGYTGTQQEWIASLHAASPTVLPLSVYPNEASAVEYMDSQPDKSVVYVWNNRVYTYCSYSVQGLSGACLYGYRASSSSGIIAGDGKSLFIIPVSDFETPLTIDFSGFALSNTPYIYGSTSPTTVTKTLISDDSYVGRTNPITITAAQLQNCAYVMFAVTSAGKPAGAGVTVNGTAINLNVITSPSEIDSAMDSGSTTVTGYVDSGVEYAYPIDGTSGAAYLKTRSTYLPPVPRAYCESKASYEAGSHYLSKYSYSAMTSMFSAVAAAHTDYVTETNLGKDASNTYDMKKYVLNAPSSLESGYTSALTNHKPVMIITAGLHGVEPDAVHTVYHFMDDLCNHYMESEELLYLHNNVKFVIVPISNPWGYVNQSYHNSNDVDINKNFEYGYRNNGSANTGTAAYSEAETQILKGVFDEYPEAVFHLECHGKYGEDTAINKTIWFSLMSSLNSELIEICADNLNSKTGMRLKELGYNTGNSTGGYITYYGLNGRPKDYTGSKYGILSATMEGTGKIYGTSGYSVDTQKINTEALENFLLTVLSGFENGL